MQKLAILALVLAVACSGKKNKEPDKGSSAPSGSSMAGDGSGSSMAGSGSGSSMAGSGSDNGSATGSGSDTGSAGSAAGSGDGSGSSAAGSGSDAGSGSAVASIGWDKKTHEEKMDYMKKTVVPTMKPLFQKFDKKKFAEFNCKTCHGKDPKKSKYKMPTAELAKLDFAKLKEGKQEPEVAKWMGEVVKPEMAKLLGMPEYTPANPKGFGCLHCHEEKK